MNIIESLFRTYVKHNPECNLLFSKQWHDDFLRVSELFGYDSDVVEMYLAEMKLFRIYLN